MTVEHRAAAGLTDIEIDLADDGHGPALRLRQAAPVYSAPEPETPEERIVHALVDAETPLLQRQFRERAATRPATVASPLQKLIRENRVERPPGGGYRLAGEDARTSSRLAAGNGKHRRDPLPQTVTASNP